MEQDIFTPRTDLEKLAESVVKVREEISKIVVGQERMVDLLIAAILSDGHVLIEGVPGVAKTLTAKLISKTISAGFSRIQFTPDLMPGDVLGTYIYNQKSGDFEFKKGPIFSNIILIDEINRAPAKTQAALFEVMEERQITLEGRQHSMGYPFIVLATQNPVEQEGTYRLPEAQLDRFLFKIEVGYPGLEEETRILEGAHKRFDMHDLSSVQAVLHPEEILNFRKIVKGLHIEHKLLHYIARIIDSTRNNSSLYLGASPRASIAVLNSSKAIAAMRGRDFVTPEDIKEVLLPVIGHRIILSPEKEMEGGTPAEVVNDLIAKIEVPR